MWAWRVGRRQEIENAVAAVTHPASNASPRQRTCSHQERIHRMRGLTAFADGPGHQTPPLRDMC